MNTRSVASLFLVSSLAVTAGATDLYWCGGTSATWNSNALLWKVDNTGDAVSWGGYEEPRTAYFTSATTFAMTGPKPYAMVVDSTGTVQLNYGSESSWGNDFLNLTNFVNKGTGTFYIWDQRNMQHSGSGLAGKSSATFDILHGGLTLDLTTDIEAHNVKVNRFLGNSLVRVGSDATFAVITKVGLGQSDGDQPSVELNGGTLRCTGEVEHRDYIKELAYNGGLIQIWNKAVLAVMGKIAVTGEVARTIDIAANTYMTLNPGPAQTEIEVADVTGTAEADFTIPVQSASSRIVSTNGFVKTGPGTLQMDKDWRGDITGVCEVREGCMRLVEKQSAMDCGEYEFVVNTNATLIIPLRNLISPGWSIWHDQYAKMSCRVYGGKLVLGDVENLFGSIYLGSELLLDDARFECNFHGATDATDGIGALFLPKKVILRGKTPYVFAPPYEVGKAWELYAAYHFYPECQGGTTITVDDITETSAPDATFSVRIRDYYSASNSNTSASAPSCMLTAGVTKEGLGTLYLTNPKNTFTGPVRVNAGTLWTDGPASAAVVASGAYLGGTGTVATATFAAGSGLSARIGQVQPLKVTTAVTLPETGVVDVYNAAETLPERVRIPVLDAPQGLSGATGEWTVRLNGTVTTDMVVSKVANQVWVKRNKGLAIIFR